MRKHWYFAILAIFAVICSGRAGDYSSPYADSKGVGEGNSYATAGIDAFGDVVGTIPCAPPGANNVWEGEAWANGELIVFKNIGPYPYASPPQFLRINPLTGAIIATVNLPFTGYVTDGCFDGTNLWIVQWSPISVIHCVSLAGVEISSFPGNLGAWKAICVAWDGTYLWAGLNAEWYNTRLHKYSTTGTLLLNWATGSAVGWYLSSEFSNQAPIGSNLYVADDAGHTIKRLNIGATVTVVEQTASPVAPPDQPVGLTFDGEYLWHGAAYANQGVFWKIDDGITTPPPNVSITLAPISLPIVIPATGGSFDFNATIANQGASPATFDTWIMAQLPNLSWYGPALGPVSLTLPGGGSITRLRTQTVPATAPPGLYTYRGYVGQYSTVKFDSSSFTFTKQAAGNGPAVGEWSNYGEDFGAESMSPAAAPNEFSLHGAYPNPFNPTTTISFELPQASLVKLAAYDVSGQLVSELINGWREAGNQQVNFAAGNLPTGVYICHLQAGEISASQKLVLMK